MKARCLRTPEVKDEVNQGCSSLSLVLWPPSRSLSTAQSQQVLLSAPPRNRALCGTPCPCSFNQCPDSLLQVRIWEIPEGGLKRNMTEALLELHGHSRRVGLVEWHPTTNNILFSAGYDYKVWGPGVGQPG